MNNPAAWHPDPTGAHEYRWWDGTRWTEHVADNGQAAVDPLPSAPPPTTGTTSGTPAGGTQAEAQPAATGTDADTSPLGAATPPTDGTGEPDRWRSSPGDGDAATASGSAGWQMPGAQSTTPRSSTQSWQSSGPAWSGGGTTSTAAPSNGMAIAAAVIGGVSLLFSFVPLIGLIGGLGGVLALILGFVAKKRATDHGVGRGAAITGIVTGILALLISVVFTAGFVIIGGDVVSTYADCIDAGGSDAECQDELNRELLDQFGQ